jgi:FMN phosphatase YigB (HAD superfamily)
MKQITHYLVLVTIFISTLASARIIETNAMEEILPHITKKTWVVFDLDNTVMEPTQTLGSDQWFDYLVKQTGSVEQAIELWESVQAHTRMQPVEEGTPILIQRLQARGYKVFALTARPQSLNSVTVKQLASLGVRFSKIVSIGPTSNKGDTLLNELSQAEVLPPRVVFVDDKQKHVKNVEEALDTAGIDNIEFRYGAADPKVRAFNAKIAAIQLRHFQNTGIIISDSQARAILP